MNWDTDTHISWQWVKCASLSFVLYHSRLKREDLQQFWVEASEGSIISEPVIPHCFTETHMHNSQLAVALSPVNHKRLLSGLKSDFNLSPSHSSYKLLNQKIPLVFFLLFSTTAHIFHTQINTKTFKGRVLGCVYLVILFERFSVLTCQI